jgi:electron transport complex protein RnfC
VFKRSFTGGVHPKDNKRLTKDKVIQKASLPKTAVIYLSQHTGALCKPIVKAGDIVSTGQKIGDSEKFISAPVHSPVSGKVTAVEPRLHPLGQKTEAIVIESDGKDQLSEDIKPYPPISEMSSEDIIKAVREAGIVGMGGAAFPTHVKLSPPEGKIIDTFIVNAAECEPFLTCDHRVMIEETESFKYGLEAVIKALGVKNVFIGIEDNKPDAISYLKGRIDKAKIVPLEAKYPQGGEKQLIKAITGREVPSGGLPLDVGVVVNNVGTISQIGKTLKTGIPLIERIITITGRNMRNPLNLRARIGTLFSDLIHQCGGALDGRIRKIVMGGPMMGNAVPSIDVAVIKGTSGILVFTEKEIEITEEESCVRCGKCVDVCPIYLLPTEIASYAENDLFDKCEALGASDCIECGSCSYECPSKINLVQLIKIAKNEILARKRANAGR